MFPPQGGVSNVFDTTPPVTQAFGDAAAVGVAGAAARRDHKHGMPVIPVHIASSTYNGDDTDNRQIALGFIPKLVIISLFGNANEWIILSASPGANICHINANPYHTYAVGTNIHASDGFVVSKSSDNSNNTGGVYTYLAIG